MRNGRNTNLTLIADDDMFIRMILKETLKPFTLLSEVTDGADVLAAYKENMPDLIFLDIHMPNVNGLQLIKEIKGVDPEAFIVMITADGRVNNVQTAVQNGAAGFIVKPFEKDVVLKSFQRCQTIEPKF